MSRHRHAFLLASFLALVSAEAFGFQSSSSYLHLTCTSLGLSKGRDDDPTSVIQSPVLAKVFPAIIAHKSAFGNPNIPLGSEDGKRCKTLRRLAFQNKLTLDEVELLTDLGFRWNSFEDVYTECDFDEMRSKLITYKEKVGSYQIPKKYEPDPELGAWVTMLRRLYKSNELPKEEIEKMDEIQFEWVSTRKCGSSFMKRYREVLEQLNGFVARTGLDASKLVEEDADVRKWIYAQKIAFENGKLSDSRVLYMDDLAIDWRNTSL